MKGGHLAIWKLKAVKGKNGFVGFNGLKAQNFTAYTWVEGVVVLENTKAYQSWLVDRATRNL